jgi:hypothetical protein
VILFSLWSPEVHVWLPCVWFRGFVTTLELDVRHIKIWMV